MTIELQKVTLDEKPVLAQLLQLYLYDLSEFVTIETTPEGRFNYSWFEPYFKEWNRYPYFVRADGQLAGFVLVRERIGCEDWNFQIAEFFIMRGYRKQGIGKGVALETLKMFPGTWGISFDYSNIPAVKFWKSVVACFETVVSHHDPDGKNRGRYLVSV